MAKATYIAHRCLVYTAIGLQSEASMHCSYAA